MRVRFITDLPVDTANDRICGRVGSFSQFVAVVPVLPVAIDIKPGVTPNLITVKAKGSIEVAVLSAPGFAAADVDPTTVRLGIASIKAVGKKGLSFSYSDVDSDGDVDLLAKFAIRELGLSRGRNELALTGKLVDGTPIRGTDSVIVK